MQSVREKMARAIAKAELEGYYPNQWEREVDKDWDKYLPHADAALKVLVDECPFNDGEIWLKSVQNED